MANAVDALLAREFQLADGLIYLNHAAVAPWPRRTAEAVARFAEENRRQGAADYPRWMEAERGLRSDLARLIGAPSPDDVALLKNTSEALSFVAYGLDWRPGDNVVISNEEFPSNRIVWESLAPLGVEVRAVRISGVADPEAGLLAACDASTRLISISSVQYASGLRLDLSRLGEYCRRRGVGFCVDAIQSVGALRHDVAAEGIDFLMADAHKWLLGPEGIALFYCRPEWRERLKLHEYGWHMVETPGDYDRREWQPAVTGRRFECGSPNMLGIHALAASASLLLEAGMEAVEGRVLERAEHLFRAISEHPALALVTSSQPGRYAGIVSFRHRAVASAELYRRLRSAGIICAERGAAIRFSPHCHTPIAQLDRALAEAAR